MNVDFFWWGGKVLGLCFWLTLVNLLMLLIGVRKRGFFNIPGKFKLAVTTTISASATAAVCFIIFALGHIKYTKQVEPMIEANSAKYKIQTDLDIFSSPYSALAVLCVPTLLASMSIKLLLEKHRQAQ